MYVKRWKYMVLAAALFAAFTLIPFSASAAQQAATNAASDASRALIVGSAVGGLGVLLGLAGLFVGLRASRRRG